MIQKVKKALKLLETKKPDDMLGSDEIMKMGVIVDTKLQPSQFTLYRLIKNKKLDAINISTGKASRYFVKVKNLKAYLKSTYNL